MANTKNLLNNSLYLKTLCGLFLIIFMSSIVNCSKDFLNDDDNIIISEELNDQFNNENMNSIELEVPNFTFDDYLNLRRSKLRKFDNFMSDEANLNNKENNKIKSFYLRKRANLFGNKRDGTTNKG